LVPAAKRRILIHLVDRIDIKRETLEIRILPGRLPAVLCSEDDRESIERAAPDDGATITFTVPARLKRAGMQNRFVIDGTGGDPRKEPDRSLLRLLSQAHRFHGKVMQGRGRTMAELAEEAGVGGSYFTRILRLSFLSPDIVKTILRDRHPIELTAKKLASDTRLPIVWEEQRARLGIA